MKKSDFYFDLPERLIAQVPLQRRDSSRLLILNKQDGAILHRHFPDVREYLKAGDCLVINNTRVIPARLIGKKADTGAAIEVLLLKDRGQDSWECIVFPGKKLRTGARVVFGEGMLTGEITEVLEDGNRIIKFEYEGVFLQVLEAVGTMPLPHYIKEQLADSERYQTVYAQQNGSAAAPTAGLHFTDSLLKEIESMGVSIAHVTLHVGLGTFRPVKAENITEHTMHSESYFVSPEAADTINKARANGGRIIAVGTTSCRTLETMTDRQGTTKSGSGSTDIFIYPGYTFKGIDGLITNFHLPESTLIMLISALAGRENVLNAYEQAVKEQYRFFSFGDAMLII